MKICVECGLEKDFYPRENGSYSRCKDCHNAAKKQSYRKRKLEGKSYRNNAYLRDGFIVGEHVYF